MRLIRGFQWSSKDEVDVKVALSSERALAQ